MDIAALAPKAEATVYPWREPQDLWGKTVQQVRDFVKAHQPVPRCHLALIPQPLVRSGNMDARLSSAEKASAGIVTTPSETAMSTVLTLGLAACVGGGLFVAREILAAFPAVNLRLFRAPAFCLLCGTAFFNTMGLFGGLFMVPIFLQQVMGFTALQAGLLILPAQPCSMLSGLLTGRLSDRFPPPFVAIAGLLTMMVIFQAFASVTVFTTVAVLLAYNILYRVFMDTVSIPVTILALRTLAVDQVRMGQGLLGVIRSIGASLGVTVTSVFFERRRTWHQHQLYATYDSNSPAHDATLHELRLALHQAGVPAATRDQEALGAIRQELDVEAIAVSFRESFLLICLCFLLAIGPMLWLCYRRAHLHEPVSAPSTRVA